MPDTRNEGMGCFQTNKKTASSAAISVATGELSAAGLVIPGHVAVYHQLLGQLPMTVHAPLATMT